MRLILLVLLFAVCATARASTPGEVEIGSDLREAKLHSLSGKTKKFADYKGKPLIINVWASWCEPCRAEMGSLQRLARKYGGKQINVIGISTDDDGAAAAALIKRAKITFENFLDSNVFLENMLGADTIPLTVLVDGRGRVLNKVRGVFEWDSPEVLDAIEETFQIKLPR